VQSVATVAACGCALNAFICSSFVDCHPEFECGTPTRIRTKDLLLAYGKADASLRSA
jgi:hypothetical protein